MSMFFGFAPASGGGAEPPATYATWDAAFKNYRIALSEGDLRATLSEGANWSTFGSTGIILPGEKKCFGIKVSTNGNTMIGFGNSSTSTLDNHFLGFTADGVGFFHVGQYYWNGGGTTYLPAWNDTNFILLAIDRVDNLVTLYKDGVAAATIAIPGVTGDLIPMASFEGTAGRYIDGYFDPDTFLFPAPSGFTGVTV